MRRTMLVLVLVCVLTLSGCSAKVEKTEYDALQKKYDEMSTQFTDYKVQSESKLMTLQNDLDRTSKEKEEALTEKATLETDKATLSQRIEALESQTSEENEKSPALIILDRLLPQYFTNSYTTEYYVGNAHTICISVTASSDMADAGEEFGSLLSNMIYSGMYSFNFIIFNVCYPNGEPMICMLIDSKGNASQASFLKE